MAQILYVEDENWQVKTTVIKFIEKGLGHKVELVNSIEVAKIKLSTEKYDVLFLDIMLNVSKGPLEINESALPLVELIKSGYFQKFGNPSTIPIIIASGVWDMPIIGANHTIMTVEAKARELGIPHDHFLQKPFLHEEVEKIFKLINIERINPK